MKSCLFLLAASVACSAVPESLPSDTTTPEYTDSFIKQHAAWCRSHFCMFEATTYTPVDEGMYDIVYGALERFKVATGRTDLTTDVRSGIPVLWQHDIWVQDPDTGDDIQVCANTVTAGYLPGRLYTQVIYLDPEPPANCGPSNVSFMHELIHGLAPDSNHVKDTNALFYGKYMGANTIDVPSLTELCTYFNCYAFEPETR